ncbi:MAG: hypothetical protein ACHQYP_04135 [Nitrospiria bacterium]
MTPKTTSPSVEEPPLSVFQSSESVLINQAQAVITDLNQRLLPPSWRVSPEPFTISPRELVFIQKLGPALLKFYKAQNRCYLESVRGHQPPWISHYLDLGKPQQIVEYGRMNRIKNAFPGIIRPDLIVTSDGMMISELDSVPGGFGLTHQLNLSYEKIGFLTIGGRSGMTDGFRNMIRNTSPDLFEKENLRLGLVVSKESEDYLPEMTSFAKELNQTDFFAYLCRPEGLYYTEDGIFVKQEDSLIPLNVIYRFLELFDYKNIPKMDLLFYASKKEKIVVTPPLKAFLEEKLWFALFHHPVLKLFWEKELGEETFYFLKTLIPQTWILDPRELPPYGVIPDLTFRKKAVSFWEELFDASQKERRFVIKPSGFSELAWGARGVKIGHDLSNQEWRSSLKSALSLFSQTPCLLQEFHQGRKDEFSYIDGENKSLVRMSGRTRLSPYYFTTVKGIELGGILATTCPSDKKIIHGMVDAIMAPCRVNTSDKDNS